MSPRIPAMQLTFNKTGCSMKNLTTLRSSALAIALCISSATSICAAGATATVPAPEKPKNWTPPAAKLYVQALTEQIMAAHPELISVTFHGVPPGAAPKTYTMFGGSYQDRIGNPDDPDDVMVIETGVTLLDPRWHRTKDVIRKFVVQTPLRDAAGENIGLIVIAYKNPVNSGKTDLDFFVAGTKLRDDLQKQIPSFAALFEPAK
jgi:hypothetical protein